MTGALETGTLSLPDDPADAGDICRRPHLFLVLESQNPLAPAARFELSKLAEVTVGRGPGRSIEHARDLEGTRLLLRVDDPWMSGTHARLTQVLRRWVLEDALSKNGCIVNGVPTKRTELADGDVIELGRTFFLFRDAIPCEPSDPPVFDLGACPPPAPGLATLLPALSRSFARLALLALGAVSVVLEGETGTGKEVVARALHALSGRTGDFVAVNCGALPETLVEGELFGHKRGAFSGAIEDRPGLIRSAHQGTLLLDEIGDLPLPSQVALLRVLQEREVLPIGATRPVPVDFRLVAATHLSLDELVQSGDFRADLFMRISGHRIELPPLSARREDLGLLLGALLQRLAPARAKPPPIHPRAIRALLRYPFPGNVRELETCIGAALLLAGDGPLNLEHLPEAVQRSARGEDASRQAETHGRREQIVLLLREHDGNVAAVARAMGKARMQVQRWIKRYDIDPTSFRPR